VAARYASRLNTLTELVITKLDVMSSFDKIKVCVAYEFEGDRYDEFPPNQTIFNKCEPVFEEFAGWKEDISGAREVGDLPKEARAYLDGLEGLVGTPISWASVGPGRDEIARVQVVG
jgi:adenylosuccinate synthase